MKKPQISVLLLVTCISAAFILGFYAGRNWNRSAVEVNTAETTPATGFTAPTAEDPSETTAETTVSLSTAPSEETGGLININTATQAELMELPGIGEIIAQRIIDYRTENGNFRTVEDLLNVSGIGEKKLEAILDLVTVGG